MEDYVQLKKETEKESKNVFEFYINKFFIASNLYCKPINQILKDKNLLDRKE